MKCRRCEKPLVPIGNARRNGRPHPDWQDRAMHKKCYVEWLKLEQLKEYLLKKNLK